MPSIRPRTADTRRPRTIRRGVQAIAVIYALLATMLIPAIGGGQEAPSVDGPSADPVPAPIARPGELTYMENEAPDAVGGNDKAASGELIAGLGTGPDDVPLARVIGEIGVPLPAPDGGSSTEDDGSFDLANPVELEPGDQTLLRGEIGDGPHAATGDFDHYAVFLEFGQVLHARTDTSSFTDGADTVLVIYDPDGEQVGRNDDIAPTDTDSDLVHEADASGFHVVAVGGCCLPQVDPEDSATGAGAGSTGPYNLVLGLDTEPEADGLIFPEEDDGSFDLANPLPPAPSRSVIEAFLGDGPHADTTGDIDMYALGFLESGTSLVADIDSIDPETSDLDTVILLWTSDGELIFGNDDDGFSFDSLLETEVPFDGEYFLSVFSCCGDHDPFDSESGVGLETTGPYLLTVELGLGFVETNGDVDVYLVDLVEGDVLSAGFAGTIEQVDVIDPKGVLRMSSFENLSFVYPSASPLRHLGEVGIDHVVGETGRHAVVVRGGQGRYRGEIRVAAADPSPVTVFLDFDGATLNRNVFDGPDGEFTVSPLSSFLFRWGLGPEAESGVIEGVVETVRENISMIGGEETGAVLLDSRSGEPAPDGEYMHIVVGGTVFESDIATIGIAESIDPGNLVRNETGLVLLDSLSSSFADGSINRVELAEGATIEELIGLGIGNVVSHEIGHLIGIWHTEVFNKTFSLMDRGGDMDGLFGLGPDGVFGTDDDIDVDFVPDSFEDFGGFEDVATRARIGLGGFTPGDHNAIPGPIAVPEVAEGADGEPVDGPPDEGAPIDGPPDDTGPDDGAEPVMPDPSEGEGDPVPPGKDDSEDAELPPEV